jgi:hypothetical protein
VIEEIFTSGANERTQKLIDKARRTNAERDRIDGGLMGLPVDVHLRTIISALVCGISMKDWDCIAEGTAMVQEMEFAVRKATKKVES